MLAAALLYSLLAQAPVAQDAPRISVQQAEETQRALTEAEIHHVSTAVDSHDGRSLPPGWWLSDERMLISGQELVRLQNREAELQAEVLKLQAANGDRARVILTVGGIGFVVGFVSAVYILKVR